MVALKFGQPEFEAVFGTDLSNLERFISDLPSHQEIQNSWCDPSIRASFGLDRFETIAAKQTRDLRKGARALLYDLSADLGHLVTDNTNFPTELLSGLRGVMQSSPIGTAVSEQEVMAIFTAESPEKALKAAGAVALGVGLAAVGTAIPIVGQIGAAVVALGKAIYGVLKAQQARLDRSEAAVREALYRTFPPLQTADSVTDSGLVQNQIRVILPSQDWTPIFLPRFRGEWVGIERDKGFAFAPGKKAKWSDEFGGDEQEAFVPSGGVGLIPGTSILTSVIQVNLDPRGQAFQSFLKGGSDPRGAAMALNPLSGAQYVIDTGSFYVATARLAALVWEWATRLGSPYLYRLDCVRMHAEWKAYCDAGIDYLRERVFPWYGKLVQARADGDQDNLNLEGFFGAAVYYGVGSWGCAHTGGTDPHPIFTRYGTPSGYHREAIKKSGLYPGSVHSGAFLPILGTPKPGFQACMGTMYERNPAIRDVLDTLQARQRSDLHRTLVCAYVRHTDAAFVGDSALRDQLGKLRALLLTSEDRFQVNMLDVPEGETHNGKDWRAQLLAAGVPAVPNRFVKPGGLRLGADDPGPPPELPPLRVGDPVPTAWKGRYVPFDRDDPEVIGAANPNRMRAHIAFGAAAFGIVLIAGWTASSHLKRR